MVRFKVCQAEGQQGLFQLLILIGVFILMLLKSNIAEAAMDNNLTNQACLTCHINYPALGTTDIKHKWINCGTCHTNQAVNSMWNCRYCHISKKFKGGSSYYLHKTPTLSEGMNRHSWDGALRYIDATFNYHSTNLTARHTSSEVSGCLGCHNQLLTEEHSGGIILKKEDFEDTLYNFTFTGSWYRNTAYPYAGSNSFRSATIPDNASTSLETNVNLAQEGKVSFWYRVSSETDYDKFYFYIDGVQKIGNISGNTGWYQVSFPLAAGNHNLKWIYVKDLYVKEFEDSVFIDDLVIYNGGRALDCNTCHLNTTAKVKNAIDGNNTNCSACHPNTDHQGRHATTLSLECTDCHEDNLVNEHKSRTDDQGRAYTCDTCHKSTNPAVINAINTNNKECVACHGPGPINHDLPHASGLDSNCLTCHTQYLNTDHDTITCGKCHNSEVPAINWAVQTGDKYCGACHGDSHGVPLDYQQVSDIPLYSGYSWSSPMALKIWQGEAWVPTNLAATGKVVFSNRSSNLTSDILWNYYKTEMAARGWTLNSAEPVPGVQEFKVLFSKEGRTCILWYHAMEDHCNSGVTGRRLEILYN